MTIAEIQKAKSDSVEFDGVINNTEVIVNEQKVGSRAYGYIGFEVDFESYIEFGEENVIAVSLNSEELSSRWYPGAEM